ncbi:c-type cytochrome [Luteolibacter ambystomatis]|uniref:C-type cytochrome n=1 Tax=Luteolibacter ambystomatis TaxID=2824561 RepID=A0A975J102_9BACT|nr:c-type cytochrome [Luteolibacter ambystomatis]QUE52004.1 c-type cytochrome [Luteolibacter ambystomatis]
MKPSIRSVPPALGILTATAGLAALAGAQDGGQLYTTYCAACHGVNGEGAQNGQFPPLAGSPWPLGNPDRSIKILIAGLHGEVEVNGKTWNLEMPPQGAMLPDDQIAAILTYVRSSWGNKAPGVETSRVKTVRAATANRTTPWTAAELLKQHPLDVKPPVADLISYVYDGTWKKLPDFNTIKAAATEEEHNGIISIAKAGRKDHFGMVWEGVLDLPVDGDYEFYLAADDGMRLMLDGTPLGEVDGIGPIQGREKQAAGKFAKGPHKLRVEFFEFEGQEEIQIGWRKKGDKNWVWLTDRKAANKPKWPDIMIEPVAEKAAIYRNFIKGTTARGIGIGLPGGVNFAWSADHFAPELIWQGEFMNGGHHWTERGQGYEPPAGDHVVNLSKGEALPEGAKFLGYKLDPKGNPTFSMSIGKSRLLDSYKAGGSDTERTLVRTLSLTGEGSAVDVVITDTLPVQAISSTEFALGNLASVASGPPAPKPKNGKLVLTLATGQTATLLYRWK